MAIKDYDATAVLSHLHRADGSATYSSHGYTIIAAVNGPTEALRRDELPEDAAIDVLVRPSAGVPGLSYSPRCRSRTPSLEGSPLYSRSLLSKERESDTWNP